MSFLLDTNIVSAHLRQPRGLVHRFVQHSGALYLSSVSLAELRVWANLGRNVAARNDAIDRLFYHEVSLVNFDELAAGVFGPLRVKLRKDGSTVSDFDLLIACTALAYDMTLVTDNLKHFKSVPSLRLENWL